MTFAHQLKASRKAQGMTLRQLGEKIGRSIGYLSDVECGRRQPPKLDLVEKIEDVLSIGDSSLLLAAQRERRHRKCPWFTQDPPKDKDILAFSGEPSSPHLSNVEPPRTVRWYHGYEDAPSGWYEINRFPTHLITPKWWMDIPPIKGCP
jgi:transcriptional regulator with XRE-family HTH domain